MKTHHDGDLLEKLVNSSQASNENEEPPPSCWTKFKQSIFKEVQTCKRTIYFNGKVEPINTQDNLVKNTKYNIITFLPKVLFNQFKFFFNMFFLVTALTQLI